MIMKIESWKDELGHVWETKFNEWRTHHWNKNAIIWTILFRVQSSLQKRNSKKMTFFIFCFYYFLFFYFFKCNLFGFPLKVLVALSMPLIFDCFVCLFVNWYKCKYTREREMWWKSHPTLYIYIYILLFFFKVIDCIKHFYMAFWKRK